MKNILVQVEISARHIHLSVNNKDKLFGKNYQFKVLKKLSQAEEFAAKEVVDIKYGGKTIKNIRVICPERKNSQIEITKTDARHLKLKTPIRLSGNVAGAPKIDVIGPKGKVKVAVIVAQRHIHISKDEAKKLGLRNNQKVDLFIKNKIRPITLHDLVVRAKDDYSLSAHIDTDEGNAAGLDSCSTGEIVLK